jgi:hypothetical protein
MHWYLIAVLFLLFTVACPFALVQSGIADGVWARINPLALLAW